MIIKLQETLNCIKEKIPRIQACYMEFITEQLFPWLVWLSGLSSSLKIEGLLVQFLVRARA